MTGTTQQVHQEPRAWAAGVYTSEAATELLIGALGGTFESVSHPWIKDSDGGLWIDFQFIPEHLRWVEGTSPPSCRCGSRAHAVAMPPHRS